MNNTTPTAEVVDGARSEGLHALSEAELAQLLGCKRSEARQRLRWLLPHLEGHIRSCRGSRIVATDVGLLALRRVKELEELCLSPKEIVSRLDRELLSALTEPSEIDTEGDLEATVLALREEIAQLRAALTLNEGEVDDPNPDPEEDGELLAPSEAAASLPARSRSRSVQTVRAPGEQLALATLAGLGGTGAMTIVSIAGPLIGLPPADIPGMLSGFMGSTLGLAFAAPVLGWAAHFMIGVTFALIYAVLFAERLPGPAILRGAVYGLVPWLAAQLIVMPVMGAGTFALASGSLAAAANSLLGHTIFGAALGGIYGIPARGLGRSRSAHLT
jgi:hypothetical protein